MPNHLTSALYNQVSKGGGEYSYDINLGSINRPNTEFESMSKLH